MQLYHHPYSLDSQKVRLALEENAIDYTSYHVNPLTGKNMESSFFRMNPSAKLPVFQNGSHIIYNTIEIIQYIERVTLVSLGVDHSVNSGEVNEWMQKIQNWNPKIFTLSHIPAKYRHFVSKFIRRVIIARMAESPDLASVYHLKLKAAYETEDKLQDPDVLRQSEEQLVRLLDDVETQLNETTYLAGDDFTMADVMLIPVLARIMLLNLEDEYILCRPRITKYWEVVKQRPSYEKVIGRYFTGWRKYRTLFKTFCFLCIRSVLKRY
ncbi:glutathione S-transferase TCHQD isoform X1 [Macadamia integrifolia]|uniref:glutathione S-transferase TCHQD isoform X1 n=1 Tax=Macadamia integrifolia TaxID=60698 RepID=UPI001C4F658B|nr:glutathione S-transferase TCHQD isoform X1 [Macadamia integrifolia]